MAEKVDQMDPDEKIVEIAIERLRVFENHPFRVEMDSQMKDLQDSIKKYGIIGSENFWGLPGTAWRYRRKQ